MMARWLTARDAAYVLSVSLAGLYKRVQRGTLPAYRLGSRLRFREADLMRAVGHGRKQTRHR